MRGDSGTVKDRTGFGGDFKNCISCDDGQCMQSGGLQGGCRAMARSQEWLSDRDDIVRN